MNGDGSWVDGLPDVNLSLQVDTLHPIIAGIVVSTLDEVEARRLMECEVGRMLMVSIVLEYIWINDLRQCQ